MKNRMFGLVLIALLIAMPAMASDNRTTKPQVLAASEVTVAKVRALFDSQPIYTTEKLNADTFKVTGLGGIEYGIGVEPAGKSILILTTFPLASGMSRQERLNVINAMNDQAYLARFYISAKAPDKLTIERVIQFDDGLIPECIVRDFHQFTMDVIKALANNSGLIKF